jgi:hypothetical protein
MGGLRGLESKVAETHRTAAELREEVSILQNDQAVAAAQPPMTPKDIQQAVEASALEPGSLLNATVLRIITEAARPAARAVLENTFRG